jgi:tetraacyldisaccharide 4'-kinase
MAPFLETLWYRKHPFTMVLAPLSWLFCLLTVTRWFAYQLGWFKVHYLEVPVIVVGNITVGGTGKTPLVIWLARFLTDHGYRAAIVCRGYKGETGHWPQLVGPASDPRTVGDEAVLLARRTRCPVVAGPDRVAAANTLLRHAHCDVIISDDGMQHLALGRQVEIAVVDGIRRHGNGLCLPAGPLREPISRLRKVDLIVSNGAGHRGEFAMALKHCGLYRVKQPAHHAPIETIKGRPVHAVCGLGHPSRFFSTLEGLGLDIERHPFPDHYTFRRKDICFNDDLPVIMTEKDAVKCAPFADARHWYLAVEAELPPLFQEQILSLLARRENGQKAA